MQKVTTLMFVTLIAGCSSSYQHRNITEGEANTVKISYEYSIQESPLISEVETTAIALTYCISKGFTVVEVAGQMTTDCLKLSNETYRSCDSWIVIQKYLCKLTY